MADLPLMPKATAVWLVENTTLTFDQIASFCGMHILEIEGIADGDVAQGIKGIDPVLTSQLTREELKRCEADPRARLRLIRKVTQLAPEPKRKGPRYTPLSKRQDRPSAIAWLVRYHPELTDGAISKLLGTTKNTIQSVRDRSHWNIANIRPVDPVALGLCKQTELDAAVKMAAARKAKAEGDAPMTDEEKMRLMSTDQSLGASREPRLPSSMSGLENFTLSDPRDRDGETSRENALDPDALFNLPAGGGHDDEDEDDDDPRR
ncbi:DUF1013 domain-containing protein [Rubrimonas cliftonensis]|uniref:DUF1013 domain-containing protein n=1 Tax=Rubrimonas cliftonensis TaxID=89524 RepID=A0A1H4A1Y8_9RHOB|nr:cell cycle transcriptional regulator TrcR [Rubrimonas cliftonensis]SEA29532.1 hypothetical protein SAMN05444370_10416 [Rubrimonas cliftonensis]